MGEEISETEAAPTPARPPRPAPSEEEEKTIIDLGELLRQRRGKGEVSFWEVLAYMDYQDRKEDRKFRREQAELTSKNTPTPSPDVEALKAQVSKLTETVNSLIESIQSERQKEAQKEFVEGVVQRTTDKIMPELQAVKQKLEQYEQTLATGEKPETSLADIKESLVEAIDRIGEKVGAGGKTLTDVVGEVDKILGLIDSLDKRRRPGEGGELDYKTMAISTVGEIGKELISAYRDISTSSASGEAAPKPETPASVMQAVIKRQVQNYITQRMKAGATTMNVQEASKELGLTPGQVMWAYQALSKEGWFHVQVPTKGKRKVKESEVTTEGEEIASEGTPTETPGEEEQVFNPPSET